MYRREARPDELKAWLQEVNYKKLPIDELVEKMQNKFGLIIDSHTAA